MKLKVGCDLEYNSFQSTPLILLLRVRTGLAQKVLNEEYLFDPITSVTEYIDLYGNYCQRLIVPNGSIKIKTQSVVEVNEYADINTDAKLAEIQDLPQESLIYLLPSRYCESDKLNNISYSITKDIDLGYQKVEAIRQWVRSTIKYEYNHSSSSTSAIDTLNAKFGVCRDLSHLAIALCRAINIPARFVVGYVYKLYPMDLHAWFEAYLDGKWYTFDATQTFVTGGRVILAYGRDAADVATATYFGEMYLNKMYVYVEEVLE